MKAEESKSETPERKKKWGDRKDGVKVRSVNPTNVLAMWIMPLRTQSELCITMEMDITNLMAYLEKRKDVPDNNIGFFNAVLAAHVRLVSERPLLNRFIKNHTVYQRKDISVGYVAKVSMSDEGIRALSKVTFGPKDTIFEVADKINDDVKSVKTGVSSKTNAAIAKIAKYPKPFMAVYFRIAQWLDKHGWVPDGLIATDPNYSSVFLSNLGSIGVDAPFHHLNNWGTNGIFVCIGERRKKLVETENGMEERIVCNFAFTLDERIADGYYYSKSVARLKEILNDPECLEQPCEYDPYREITF